jgi:hypothetical protein
MVLHVHVGGAVAILALDREMDVFPVQFIDVGVAFSADLSSLVNRFQVHDLSQGVGPVVPELSEAFRLERTLHEESQSGDHNQDRKHTPDV